MSGPGMRRSMRAPIAVIGAGLAGLACASALQAAGCTVTVFEKSRGVGGRMSTRRGDGWQADHGAQYFTARDPAFRQAVAAWQAAGIVAEWQPRLQVIGAVPNGTQRHDDVRRLVGVPAMNAPARALADGLSVLANHRVTALRRQDGGWRLHTAEAGELPMRYSQVVIAVPPAQAVPLLHSHAPALATFAAGARMQPCLAMMLQFAAPVPLPFDAAFVNDGPLRWIARDASKPGRTGGESWVLHAQEAWSEAHVDSPLQEACALLLDAFLALGGPRPRGWRGHFWRYARGEVEHPARCAMDEDAGLGVCGDWLAGGRVEGAWLSGQALARALLS
jgi:renalase